MRSLAIVFVSLSFSAFGALELELKSVSDQLSSPVHVTTAPGEGSALFVVEQRGRILKLSEESRSVFLDIRDQVTSGGEMGLLSVAFHPEYANEESDFHKKFYVNYTRRVNRQLKTFISEFDEDLDERVLMTIDQPFSNHNGGQIAFGPADGYLYIGMGDGGAGGDPRNYAQNLQSLLGKMLRIDVTPTDTAEYQIPESNPTFSRPAKPEIYAYGLRNPWRFSFDAPTGRLFAGDVGQTTVEEIHIINSGKNYGWKIIEGTRCFSPTIDCDKTGLELPIFEYERNLGYSITGGFVYRGSALPDLVGTYVYADYGSGLIWGLKQDEEGAWQNSLLIDSGKNVSSFGVDSSGELLVVDLRGNVTRIVETEDDSESQQ